MKVARYSNVVNTPFVRTQVRAQGRKWDILHC